MEQCSRYPTISRSLNNVKSLGLLGLRAQYSSAQPFLLTINSSRVQKLLYLNFSNICSSWRHFDFSPTFKAISKTEQTVWKIGSSVKITITDKQVDRLLRRFSYVSKCKKLSQNKYKEDKSILSDKWALRVGSSHIYYWYDL